MQPLGKGHEENLKRMKNKYIRIHYMNKSIIEYLIIQIHDNYIIWYVLKRQIKLFNLIKCAISLKKLSMPYTYLLEKNSKD